MRSDAVTMLREDLSISLDKVSVDYIFRNTSEVDVESLVAFPMPISCQALMRVRRFRPRIENFLGFRCSSRARRSSRNCHSGRWRSESTSPTRCAAWESR